MLQAYATCNSEAVLHPTIQIKNLHGSLNHVFFSEIYLS